LLQLLNSRSPDIPPVSFFEIGAISTMLVLLGAALWNEFRQWWILNGSVVLSLVGKLLIRLIRGNK
ncbi:hypothetical protein, partial [Pseudomonas gessardii]